MWKISAWLARLSKAKWFKNAPRFPRHWQLRARAQQSSGEMTLYTGPVDTTPLPYPVDERLRTAAAAEEIIMKPPQVSTLEEWGDLVLTAGVKKGMTYQQAYQDKKYADYMKGNPTLRSPWAISFQNYVRAHDQLRPRSVKVGDATSQQPRWPTNLPGNRSSAAAAQSAPSEKAKRALELEQAHMQVEIDAVRIQELQAKIAVLQRELDSARQTIWQGDQ